jgi:hypothetical protein
MSLLGLIFVFWLIKGGDPIDAIRSAFHFVVKMYAYLFGFVFIVCGIVLIANLFIS